MARHSAPVPGVAASRGPAAEEDTAAEVGAVLARAEVEEGWSVVVVDPPEDRARVVESVLSVSDGVIGTRGSLEEDGPASSPAAFAGGVYEAAADTGQALLTLPSWALLELPPWLAPGERWLDLRRGVLWRRVLTPAGAVLRSARWACMARPGTEVLVVEGDASVAAGTPRAPGHARIERHSSLGGAVAGVIDTDTAAADGGGDGGPALTLSRVASFSVSGTGAGRAPDVSVAHRAARRRGVAGLFEEQQAALARQWEVGDLEVVGDPELTRAVRFSLLQLWGAAAEGGEAAVGARGLTGPAYAGHVFWDADVFVLPVLAATRPAAARAMLEYRIRRLPAARRAAEAAGRRGVRFPWESAADGTDVTPRQGIDESGRTVPIRTGELEEHITADVAWAAWQYASWTGDWGFLEGPGRALVVDTARYWESRIRTDATGAGHIDGVIGPDEYHEDVDDNAFTNVMAAWNLRRGAELLDRTSPHDGAAEAAHWRAVADALVTGFDPATGRHEQFAGYHRLEPLLAADLGTVPVAADLVLGRDRLVASQIVKQADVVMAHHLVPDALAPGSLERDLGHYMARTAHGSSLSPAVHALVAARAGRLAEAANLLDLAWRIDLEDLTGTAGGGLHLAALGGLWQALVSGFAGLRVQRPDDPVLWIDPRLAEHWEELRFGLRWHGADLRLRCRADAVFVGCTAPVKVVVGGAPRVTVDPPGTWIGRETRR